MAKTGPLPQETQDFVRTITGLAVESWSGTQAGSPALKLPQDAPCQESAGLLAWNGPERIPMPLPKPGAKDAAAPAPVVQDSAAAKKKDGTGEAQAGP